MTGTTHTKNDDNIQTEAYYLALDVYEIELDQVRQHIN
jgi:hypothetical protein